MGKSQGTPANSINGNFVNNIATEKTASNENDRDDGSDGESAATTKNDTQQQAKSDAEPPVLDAQSKDRFDALVRDRDSLRAEVTGMRKSLEEIQSKHRADMEALQQRVDDAESKKGQAETQYQKLLERVNTIKAQLGERLKEDAVCSDHLVVVLLMIFELTLSSSGFSLRKKSPRQGHKLKISRSRTPISQLNWIPNPRNSLISPKKTKKRPKRYPPCEIEQICPSKTGQKREMN